MALVYIIPTLLTIGSACFPQVHVTATGCWWCWWDDSIQLTRPPVERRPGAGPAVLTAWYGWRSVRIVQQNYELGLGYTSLAWQHSETIAAIQQLPPDALIVTNEENAILFLTGRHSYPLAEIYYDQPLAEFTRYGDGDLTQDEAQRLFRQDGAALVLFDSIYSQLEGLYGERLDARVSSLVQGLEVSFRGDDGAIYYYPER